MPLLVGFPAPGALCETAGCGVAGLCAKSLEATLADWLTGRGCGPGIPVSRDQMSVYMCRALLGGDHHPPAGLEAVSFPDLPAEHSPLPCFGRAGTMDLGQRFPHGRPVSSIDLGCGQMAVPIIGALARQR
jgi:hypothetical protein